jgi:Na+/melibiose symporter-like transporter
VRNGGPDRRLLLAYALPALVLAVPMVPAYVLLPAFYAGNLGLSAVAAALFVARLVDIATDPLAGLLIDRLPTRFGRRKPWILLGGLVAAPALLLLFSPPPGAGPLWLAASAALLFVGWTLIAVPYWTWGAELAPDYAARTRVTTARETCTLAGILLSAALPAGMVQAGFATGDALRATAIATIGAGLPAFVLLLRRVPEPPAAAPAAVPGGNPLGLLRNRPLLRLLSIWLVNGLAGGIAGVLFPLFVTERLGSDEAGRGLFLLLYMGAAVLAMPLWAVLAARIGKHRSWLASMFLAIPAFAVVPALGEGDVAAFALVCVVTGAAFGADLALPPAIQADVADYDRLRFASERTALIFGLSSMVVKLALALSVAIAFPLLDLAGFRVGGPNDAAALAALAWIYAGLPVAAKLAAAAMLAGFPIDRRRQEVIRRRLAARTAHRSRRGDGRVAEVAPAGDRGPASDLRGM